MEIKFFSLEEYCDIERDLCSIHAVAEENEAIDAEWKDIKQRFSEALGSSFAIAQDYEFPDWHSNIQMLWIYLYAEKLYSPLLIVAIRHALAPYDGRWFAQCECYSDQPVPGRDNVSSIGDFIIQKDMLLVSQSEAWPLYLPKLGFAVPAQ